MVPSPGERCWVRSRVKDLVWERGRLLSIQKTIPGGLIEAIVELERTKCKCVARAPNEQSLDSEVLPCNSESASTVSDLIGLTHLHEAAILDILIARAAQGSIYTRIGDIVLAVNPFKALPYLYGPEVMLRFAQSCPQEPHCYGVADAAFRSMRSDRVNQAILISGESGAGKTESSKTSERA